jgi:hypothetical protein
MAALQLAQVASPPAQKQEDRRPESLLRLRFAGLSPAAETELRNRLGLQVGQPVDEAAFQHARQVVHDFASNLRLDRTWVNMDTPGHGIWLTVSSPEGGPASNDPLAKVPRRLHLAFEGIPDAQAEALRQRLALNEDQPLEPDALHKELARIHQIVTEFDPHLSDKRMRGKAPHNLAPDGKPIIPDVIDVTLVIAAANNAGNPMEQFARFQRVKSLEDKPVKLLLRIQGLSSDQAADLRSRLKVPEGQMVDAATLRQTVARVRGVLQDFTPQLSHDVLLALATRPNPGGHPLPGEPVAATILIQPAGAGAKTR